MQFATLLKGVTFLASASLILSANIPARDNSVAFAVSGDSAQLLDARDWQGRFCIMDGIPGQNWAPVLSEAGSEPIVIYQMAYGSPNMVGIGARVCTQMACASNAAIWWCNDNGWPLSIDRVFLANAAININANCLRGQWTGGQLFNSDGWNVILDTVPQCDVGYTYSKREESAAHLEAREADVTLPVERDLAVEPRGNYLGLFCIKDGIPGQNWNWIDISSGYIDQALSQLDNSPWLVSAAGPGYCGQAACYGRSAIYWCNDNNHAISVYAPDLAQMARYIVQNCKETVPWWHSFSGGQLFNSDGYNIIVRDGQCDEADAKHIKREDLMAEIDDRAPNAAAVNENTARAEDGIPVDVQCPPDLGWEYANYDAAMWGYEYLKDIVQPINVEPEHCLKVFCIGDTGIFVCNPSPTNYLTITSEEVANLVLTLANACHAGTYTGGRVWDSDGWFVNIINTPC